MKGKVGTQSILINTCILHQQYANLCPQWPRKIGWQSSGEGGLPIHGAGRYGNV